MRSAFERADRFELLPPVLGLESLLIKAANGETYDDVLHNVEQSCHAPDLDFTVLRRQLPLVVDVKQECVRKVTSIRTICEAMKANLTYKLVFLKYTNC